MKSEEVKIVWEEGTAKEHPLVEKSITALLSLSQQPTQIRVGRGSYSTHISIRGVWKEGTLETDFHVGKTNVSYWEYWGFIGDRLFSSAADAYQAMLDSFPRRESKERLNKVILALRDRVAEVTHAFDVRYPPRYTSVTVQDYTGATGRNGDSGNSVSEKRISRTDENQSILEGEIRSDPGILALEEEKRQLEA